MRRSRKGAVRKGDSEMFRSLTPSLVLLLAAAPAFGAKFANQFSEFELPPQWQCNLEGAEWVCQNSEESRKRDAIIVLAAKLKGDQDSLDQYLAFLKNPKTFVSVQGKQIRSEPKYAKNTLINGHAWADALHLESEIPGFYTRYLATVQQDIGVLVTYSISKTKYAEYLQDFENMVKTLKVFRKPGGINKSADGDLFQGTSIPTHISEATIFPGAAQDTPITGGSDGPASGGSGNEESLLLPLLLIAGAVGFLIWRRRRQGS